MRVTFVCPTLNMSGGIRVVALYAERLARKGHDVSIVSQPQPRPSLRQRLKELAAGRRQAPSPADTSPHLPSGSPVVHKILPVCRPVEDRDLPDSDVVIATWWETAEWVAALSPSKGAKIYFVQGHEVFPFLPVDRCRATYRMPLKKIVVSEWLRKIMADEYGDFDVAVVPNAIDHTQFHAAPRGKQPTPTIGTLHSRTPLKGTDVAIEALAILRSKLPQTRAVVFGVEAASRSIAENEAIEYFHRPPQHRLRELYARCDLWITASRSEGFNLTAMEAMACRTPVLATPTGWPADAIRPGVNGYLVDFDSPANMADAALRVLELPQADWRRLSDNAFETVRAASWEASAELFEAALVRHARRGTLSTP